MSWTNGGAAIQVCDTRPDVSSAPQNLPLTSTSSILLSNPRLHRLRIYVNDVGFFEEAMKSILKLTDPTYASAPGAIVFVSPASDSTWTGRLGTPEQRIGYVESAEWTTRPGTASGFVSPVVVDMGSPGAVYQTCVPVERAVRALNYAVLTSLDAGTWEGRRDPLLVTYKDPSVVALPQGFGGGWLMVMARYIRDPKEGSPSPDNSFGQIVAWWSDTQDFTGPNTVGPFLLVDGANAWAEGEYVRLWVGTPGVAVVPDGANGYDLFVYYSVDATSRGYRRITKVGEAFRDPVTRVEYYNALRSLGFSPGVAAKRVPLGALWWARLVEQAAEGDFPYTDEDGWNPGSALVGTLLGGVRLWFPNGERLGRAHSVRSFFWDYSADSVRFADPAPAVCGDASDSLALYVAANVNFDATSGPPFPATSSSLGSGHGLWRARAISEGKLLMVTGSFLGAATRTRVVATFGKDFLCATQDPGATTFKSPDQVEEAMDYTSTNYSVWDTTVTPYSYSLTAIHVWMDPDPVALDDGTWRVTSGASMASTSGPWPSGITNPFGDNTACTGTKEDGCATADDLLDDDVWTDIFPLSPAADFPGV